MASTGARAPTPRYGSMRENVLALTVVTAEGMVVHTVRTPASPRPAGDPLTRLFVGPEGTLGIITEVNAALHPLPEAVSAAVVNFPSAQQAVNVVIRPSSWACRWRAANSSTRPPSAPLVPTAKLELRGKATHAVLRFHGRRRGRAGGAGAAAGRRRGRDGLAWARSPKSVPGCGNARHDAYQPCWCEASAHGPSPPIPAYAHLRLAASVEGAQAAGSQRLPSLIVGHVGDGNFHCLILVDGPNPDGVARAEALNREIVSLGLSLGGTCTGEQWHRPAQDGLLGTEAGAEGVALMARIRRRWIRRGSIRARCCADAAGRGRAPQERGLVAFLGYQYKPRFRAER